MWNPGFNGVTHQRIVRQSVIGDPRWVAIWQEKLDCGFWIILIINFLRMSHNIKFKKIIYFLELLLLAFYMFISSGVILMLLQISSLITSKGFSREAFSIMFWPLFLAVEEKLKLFITLAYFFTLLLIPVLGLIYDKRRLVLHFVLIFFAIINTFVFFYITDQLARF